MRTLQAPTAPHAGASNAPTPPLPLELQRKLAGLTELSTLSEVTFKILEIIKDPRSSAKDLAAVVSNDPSIAAKIIKVVNSALYGLARKISDLDQAIVLLGHSTIKTLALATSLAKHFPAKPISEQFTARDLWRHCIAVGVCCRLMAKYSRVAPEEAFVAGLVHDIGMVAEFQLFPEKLRGVVEHCAATADDFCETERERIGADHQAFGASLAARWGFPLKLRSAICAHHHPIAPTGRFRELVTVVQVADIICCEQQYGFWLTARGQQLTVPMLETIGVTAGELEKRLEPLTELTEEAVAIFSA